MVDTVFAQDDARPGVVDPENILHHEAFRIGQAGVVELWPPVIPEEVEALAAWSPPVVARWGKDPQTRLADGIAARIREWIDNGEVLQSKNRPLRPGDIMVLVRRRGAFVEKLVRSLKRNDIPVAGVDRMVLSEQLAVRDLIALGEFLLLPEDELNLATVLKGPMIGFSEDDLFDLAYDRGDENLWSVLRRRRIKNQFLRLPWTSSRRFWHARILHRPSNCSRIFLAIAGAVKNFWGGSVLMPMTQLMNFCRWRLIMNAIRCHPFRVSALARYR